MTALAPRLDAARATEEALARMATFHADVVQEVERAVLRDKVVVVGMDWNPHVIQARRRLSAAGVPFTYIGHGNYLWGWRKRLAVKLWSGWPTFPQVFVNGTLIGGDSDLARAMADGSFQKRLG
jgi:glutaredoxin-related protein